MYANYRLRSVYRAVAEQRIRDTHNVLTLWKRILFFREQLYPEYPIYS